MMKPTRYQIWLLAACLCLGWTALAVAGAQGPKPKLDAPMNVKCPVVDGGVTVTFDPVSDAHAYQVGYIAVMADGKVSMESDFLAMPPSIMSLEGVSAMIAHVRAMPEPKHEGGPPQGSGPKGRWSEACVVNIPVTQ